MKLNVLIEGWINVPHSYAIVNIYQILALAKCDYIQLYFDSVPKYNEDWPIIDLDLLVTPEEKSTILNLKYVDHKTRIDIIYRISFPINTSTFVNNVKYQQDNPILVFYTSEFQMIPDSNFCFGFKSEKYVGFDYFLEQCKNRRIIPITPSKWSSMALKRHGYDPLVIPHGVDVTKYYYTRENKNSFRESYSIPLDAFVYLNIGAATQNKNIKSIIKAFYNLAQLKENVHLVLKGIEGLYSCGDRILGYIKELIGEQVIDRKVWKRIKQRFIYIPDTLDYIEMNNLYNACDCYVSPYIAEGFNMPVLEAIACGLPVIVSKGGPTDDFTNDDFALYPQTVSLKTTTDQYLLVVDDLSLQEKMLYVINNPEFVENVKKVGPLFVKENFTWDKVVEKLLNFFNLIKQENYTRLEATRLNIHRIRN
jgi:glycosyltransferase involved in cell wall biosynthesis